MASPEALTEKDFRARIREHRQRARLAVSGFVEGARTGDHERMTAAFPHLDFGQIDGGGWARAFRGAAALPRIRTETRQFFLRVWVHSGGHIRQETSNDRALIDGLKALLPRYRGKALKLFRGEGLRNHRRRSYGAAWSTSRDVADGFAQGYWRYHRGGSVLLETKVPAKAIICAVAGSDEDRYGEDEYLVDGRMLGEVRIIERYSELVP